MFLIIGVSLKNVITFLWTQISCIKKIEHTSTEASFVLKRKSSIQLKTKELSKKGRLFDLYSVNFLFKGGQMLGVGEGVSMSAL